MWKHPISLHLHPYVRVWVKADEVNRSACDVFEEFVEPVLFTNQAVATVLVLVDFDENDMREKLEKNARSPLRARSESLVKLHLHLLGG